MTTKHLTDQELQLFAFDKVNCEIRIAEHIHTCGECKEKVEVYMSLATSIKQQPQPAFDFDLSELLLEQLPISQPKPANDKLLTGVLIFVCTGFISGALFYFRSYWANMFEGVATILIFLIAISAITVIAALVFDMHKKFQKEMKVLDLY